jgi:hypothetical protein
VKEDDTVSPPKCELMRVQVSKLKKMENVEAKLDRDTICRGNIQLGSRMRYSYKYLPYRNI